MSGLKYIELDSQTTVILYKGYFVEQGDNWLSQLKTKIDWQQPSIKIMGRTLPIPRLQAYYGDKGAFYRYSNLNLSPLPFNLTLSTIKSAVEDAVDSQFNAALLNLYRTGQDSMGFHADDEPSIDDNFPIASVSLGETRAMRFKSKFSQQKPTKCWLSHGDLLVMPPKMQSQWLHEVPKTKRAQFARINITFRKVRISDKLGFLV